MPGSPAPPVNGAEVGPTATAIASRDSRLTVIVSMLVFGGCFIDIPFYYHWWRWAQHIPIRIAAVVAYVAVVTVASIWLLYRGCRLGARFDDVGITVRRLLRTDRYSWPEVSRFADGYGESQGGRFWALKIMLSNGGCHRECAVSRINATAKTLGKIRQVAARHEIPTFRKRKYGLSYEIDAVDWFLGQFLLPPGRGERDGIGPDPWGSLPVARVARRTSEKYAFELHCLAGWPGLLSGCVGHAGQDGGAAAGCRAVWVSAWSRW